MTLYPVHSFLSLAHQDVVRLLVINSAHSAALKISNFGCILIKNEWRVMLSSTLDLQQDRLRSRDSNLSFPRALEVVITLTSSLRPLYSMSWCVRLMNE
jgi:hypothetical protein